MIRDFYLLLKLQFLGAKNQAWDYIKRKPFQSLLMISVGLLFYWAFLWIVNRFLGFIYSRETIGVIITTKLIQLLLMVALGISVMSSLTTAISNLYMSKDLEFQFSLPVRFSSWIYFRQSQIILHSCWMVFVFATPIIWVFLSLSKVSLAPKILGIIGFLMLVSFAVFIATIVGFVLVRLFPARRVHQVLFIVSVVLMSLLVFYFRYIEPEKFIGPGGMEEFNGYLDLVDPTAQNWNPAKWAGDFLTALSQHQWVHAYAPGYRLLALFLGLQIPFLACAFWFYRPSWDRALQALSGEKPERVKMGFFSRRSNSALSHNGFFQEGRESLLLLRDPAQWSQVFILIGLLALYLYSITKLPVDPFGGSRFQLALANTGFVAFVGLSISSRFIFTSFSMEGQAFWLLKCAPENWGGWIRSKVLIYGTPCLCFVLALGVGSGLILNLKGPELLRIGMATGWDIGFIVCYSACLGVLFMNPNIENPNKLMVTPGGFLLMSSCMVVILLHSFLRLAGSGETVNRVLHYFLRWPNVQGGKYWIYALSLAAVEIALLAYLYLKARRHLSRAENLC